MKLGNEIWVTLVIAMAFGCGEEGPELLRPGSPNFDFSSTTADAGSHAMGEGSGNPNASANAGGTDEGIGRVSLTWPGASGANAANLDLHVMDPEGVHIYYLSTVATNGNGRFAPNDDCRSFDCDGTQTSPRETVHWQLPQMLEGEYEVWVTNAGPGSAGYELKIEVGDVQRTQSGNLAKGAESEAVTFRVGTDPDAPCLQQLDDLGIEYDSISIDEGGACKVDDAILLRGPINGVTYRVAWSTSTTKARMACDLALALHELGGVLKRYDITDVHHAGAYVCKNIAGSSNPSQHSYGLGIDLNVFVAANGSDYSLERDWEHDTEAPTSEKGRVLYEIGQAMHTQGIFNTVLTPNYDSDHDNHFHVDLAAGRSVIRSGMLDETGDQHDEHTCH